MWGSCGEECYRRRFCQRAVSCIYFPRLASVSKRLDSRHLQTMDSKLPVPMQESVCDYIERFHMTSKGDVPIQNNLLDSFVGNTNAMLRVGPWGMSANALYINL